MKAASFFIAILVLALFVIPMVSLSFGASVPGQAQPVPHTPSIPSSSPEASSPPPAGETAWQAAEEVTEKLPEEASLKPSENGVSSFKILDQATGQVVTVSLQDFVRGAVAAEMPVSFHPEALKAQAVAAHTYALHNHYVQQQSPDPSLKGADFAADPSNMLVYITEDTARDFYGEKADLYWDKICRAADSVAGYVLEYQDEPIVAAYHAISAGQTEDASNVWTGSAPYLQASDSVGDYLAPDYETTVSLSRSAVENALGAAYPAAGLPPEPEDWFRDIQRSGSGYITSVDIGGTTVHGKEIRTLFDLRSHNMDINYDEGTDRFTFTIYGYGHGVGLSQYGADFLARQGYTFDEILKNYYTGVALREISVDGLAQEPV